MRVTRRRGTVRLRLDPVEAALLASLFSEMAATLAQDALAAADPVRQRLYPAGHRDDPEAAQEFRSLTEPGLRTERSARALDCAAQVRAATDVELDRDRGRCWIQALNDIRLTLGTRLGISETDPDPDPADPDFQQRSVYYWLTGVQDSLVHALMT